MNFTLLDGLCGSSFWDEDLLWKSTEPDLTSCFQYTALTWIPCAFLWLFAPLECYLFKKSKLKELPWTGTNITRIIVALALAILQCFSFYDIMQNRNEDIFIAAVLSVVLKFITFLFSVIVMLFNRKKGGHTSGVLFGFWLLLLTCGCVTYRSAFIKIGNGEKSADEISFITEMIYFPLVITEFILTCIADIRYKQASPSHKINKRAESPEMYASYLSKLLFWWFNKLAILGWKKPLKVEDLWGLNSEDCTDYVAEKFEKNYQLPEFQKQKISNRMNGVIPVNETGDEEDDIEVEYVLQNGVRDQPKIKVNIVKTITKTYAREFILGSSQKLVYDILQFVSPILLSLIIKFMKSDDPMWIGILYAVLLYIVGQVQSLVLGHYFQSMLILGMRIRTALITAIYKKSLVMSSSAKKEFTVGEIVNLMSVDAQRFMDLMTYLNLLWSSPLQIIICLVMLFRILSYSVLAGFFMSVILIPINIVVASQAKKRQEKQMTCKDERVKLVNEVLSGIKVLKLYAWEEAFQDKIEAIRFKEVKHLTALAYLSSIGVMIWSTSPYLVALVTFATYVLVSSSNVLDAETAFVSISLFNILRFPLTMLPNLISSLIMASVSVKRINKFLNCEELSKYVIHDSTQNDAVLVRNGEFVWEELTEEQKSNNVRPTLSNINLSVKRKSLVAVVGQVGVGKSSLLSAILGEMHKLQGSVSINGSIAYVTQQPWIQNSTLQNNILFSKKLNKRAFDDIIENCGLAPDLDILPGGIHTEIGEKGINLSGGQKQRVSLARAVYSSADIYLLDDPLSAVDSHVGKHIFDKVIGPNGMLRKKTRILVTHSLTYLPQVDHIFVMKDGEIAEHGSFQELVESKGPFAEFLATYGSQIDEEAEIDSNVRQYIRSISERSSIPEDSVEVEESLRTSLVSINRSSEERSASLEKSTSSLANHAAKLIQIETVETGNVKISVYGEYFRAIGYLWVIAMIVGYIIWQVFSVGSNIWLSDWGQDPPLNGTAAIQQRNYRLGGYAGLGVGLVLFILLGQLATAKGTLEAAILMHSGILINILKSPMSFFDTTPLGRIVNRFGKDIDTVDVIIPQTVRSWLTCLLQVVATIIVISMQTPLFLLVIVPLLIIYYFIQRFYLATSRQLKRLESITRSPIYSHFSETLSGTSTIRAYRAEERFCQYSNSLVDNNLVCYYPSIIANRWLSIRLDFIGNVIILTSALFSVLQKESLTQGNAGLSITYALSVTQTLAWLVRMSSELETNIVAVERLLEYTNTPTEAEWVVENNRPPKEWPATGKVKFDNYSTRYREGLDLVLKQISCDLKDGEKVGIVGRTGAGKSSLTLSLFRIIEGVEGDINIDQQQISKMGLHDLRSKITIIPQDPVLFSGTLRMNLDPFDWHTDAQLWESLEHAHLKNFVSGLEKGLNHEVVEGGENLSVGQRQLVCLARALLRKTKILVLDEATAAVDLETDSLIQDTIRQEFKDCSVLTIAHRLNTVMDYNRIMVLHEGKVAEFDSPNVLLQDRNSIFYGMAKDAGLV